jgi:hypothetical protein
MVLATAKTSQNQQKSKSTMKKTIRLAISLSLLAATTSAADPSILLNRLMVFNPNTDLRAGETSEFSTLETLKAYFSGANDSSILIGVGEAFPFPNKDDKKAHELFVFGASDNVKAFASDPLNGRASPLSSSTPLTFSVFALIDSAAGQEIIYDNPAQAGKVLWNFHKDETVQTIFKKGFHNSYSNTDGGATETLFNAAADAQKNGPLQAAKWRQKLSPLIPSLSQEPVWTNFSQSTAATELETTWLAVLRKNGWGAAAIVVDGTLLDVNHFRVTSVSKINPKEGGLIPSKPKNYILENNHGDSAWLMAGFMIDPQNPEFKRWQEAMEAFGQGIHFHGARTDGEKVGHILTAVLGTKPVTVKIYPLTLTQTASSGVFNNDVSVSISNVQAGQKSVEITVENSGRNFIRNLDVVLLEGTTQTAKTTIAVIEPGEKLKLTLNAKKAWSPGLLLCTAVDPDSHLIEGGLKNANNKSCLK